VPPLIKLPGLGALPENVFLSNILILDNSSKKQVKVKVEVKVHAQPQP